MGANRIDAGGLRIEIKILKNQRPPAEVAPAPSRGHPHSPALLVVADLRQMVALKSVTVAGDLGKRF